MKKIAIIGAGAAGLMTAATIIENAPNQQYRIDLYEKNAIIGHKVKISGGGRCNVTTGIHEIKQLLKNYPRGGKFLRYAFHQFPPDQVYHWFEEHRIPLKTEQDLRVFPQSNKGQDVVDVFTKIFEIPQITVHFRTAITPKDLSQLNSDFTVFATGGQAYRHTGSTGDGYTFAEELGHTVTDLAPSLNSFILQEKWAKEIPGVALAKATVKACKQSYTGPILFTHKGLSGPATFALSSMVAFEHYDQAQPLAISIDLLPDLNEEQLRQKIQQLIAAHPKQELQNIFKSLSPEIPKSLRAQILKLILEEPTKKANETGKKSFNKLISLLKNLTVQAIGRGAGSEFVTAGGITLTEINDQTMESKKTPTNYFVGELLNIDGFTGGFNLQASWATGRAAGLHITSLL